MKKKLAVLILMGVIFVNLKGVEYDKSDEKRLAAVERFVEKVQKNAVSKKNPTPLIGDGLNVDTDEVVEWVYEDGRRVKISNFASQQNYLRVLVGLSEATGATQYEETAREMAGYFMDNFTDENGLFYWGGHRFVNLDTMEVEGPQGKNKVHELKNHFPYIELLHSVNRKKTEKFARQFWNAHVEDWDTLDMGRHGSYSKRYKKDIFSREKKDIIDKKKLPKLPETRGLTFINAANDLIYFGYKLSQYTGEEQPGLWAKHVAKQYVDARNPETGMPVYQFTAPKRRADPPRDDSDTNSKYGDRAQRQFGPEFGDVAYEGNAVFQNSSSIIRENTIIQLEIYKMTGDEEMLRWTISGLKNFYGNAYNKKTNEITPMWNDGTDLTGYRLKRDGYYGKKGRVLKGKKANGNDFLPLVRAAIVDESLELWGYARTMAKHLNLGDIGSEPGKNLKVNLRSISSSPEVLFALLDLSAVSGNKEYLKVAKAVGDNILKNRIVNDYFVKSKDHMYTSVNSSEALAIVALDNALKDRYEKVPTYLSEGGYLHGEFLLEDGTFKTAYDKDIYYRKKR